MLKNCSYKIKMPGGNDIVIPANFGTFEIKGNNNFTRLIKEVKKDPDENKYKLIDYIYKYSSDTLNKEFISNQILNNTDNIEQAISNINDKIVNSVETFNFERALNTYLARIDQSTKGKNVDEILEDLNKPLPKGYLSEITSVETSSSSILNSTNLKSEHGRIKTQLAESNNSGLDTFVLSDINEFLNYIQAKNASTNNNIYEAKNFLQNTTNVGDNTYLIKDYIFYKENDPISLFLSAFKKVGSLTKFGEDFQSTKVENELTESVFDKHLKAKDKAKITEYVNEVSNYLSLNNTKLKTSILEIFSHINPELYPELWSETKQKAKEFIKSEFLAEKQYRDYVDDNHILELNQNRVNLYKPTDVFVMTSYDDFIRRIDEREDLIYMKLGEDSFVALYPKLIRRSGANVFVHGINVNKTGDMKDHKITFYPGDEIFFRKRFHQPHNEKTLETLYEERKDLPRGQFLAKEGVSSLNNKVLSSILEVGDIVYSDHGTKPYTVRGINGSSVTVKRGKNLYDVRFSSITGIESNKLASDEGSNVLNINNVDIKLNSPIHSQNGSIDTNLISTGDAIEIPNLSKSVYRRVVNVTTDNVVVLYKDNTGVIRSSRIPKADIKKAWSDTYHTLTTDELDLVASNDLTSLRKSNMSIIKNRNGVRNGDYYTYNDDGKTVIGKVLDNVTGKSVEYRKGKDYKKYVKNINNVPADTTFLTYRDISSTYALSVLRVNDWDIKLEKTQADNLYQEVDYMIPEDYEGDLYLLPSNYANVGQYVTKGYKLEGFKKATSEIKKLIKSKGNKVDKLYVLKTSANNKHYFRNTTGLDQVPNYSKLDQDIKEALDVIQPGVYIQLFDSSTNINDEIYRIIKVSGNTVIAHYNKINVDGVMLTKELELSKEELLAPRTESSAPVNSIANVWVQYENKNILPLLKDLETSTPEKITNMKSINKLIFKMNQQYSDIGVTVEKGSSGFTNNQHAKIETDTDGNVKIVLNVDNGTYSDLVHENLHVMLIRLRHSEGLDAYGHLLDALLGEEYANHNVYDKEEEFVKRIVDYVMNNSQGFKGPNDFTHRELSVFMQDMVNIVNQINPNLNYKASSFVNNPLELLTKRLTEIYDIDINDNSNPYFNFGVLAFETGYRNWLKDNNIKLKCK